MAFQNRVLAEYAAVGVSIDVDKATVMRALSRKFAKGDMRRLYAVISRQATRP